MLYFDYIYVLPIILMIWLIIALATTYTLAVINKHVEPILPYVSDTGAWPPESSIFTFMIAVAAIILGIIIYVRYLQIKSYHLESRCIIINTLTLISGLVAVLGLLLAASFQETNVLAAHLVGAALAFGSGTLYQLLQSYLSKLMLPFLGSSKVAYLRLLFAIISLVTSIVAGVYFILAYLQFQGDNLTMWKEGDPGYLSHFIGAIAEWTLVISTVLYMQTFVGEFRDISLSEPTALENVKIDQVKIENFAYF